MSPLGQGHRGIGMTSDRTRARLIQRLRDQGIKSERVLERIRTVPRHIFVDEALASRAYEDTALPIGHGQTISQPYVVARMTEALLGSSDCERVLEIGTGCGYQTAILAPFVKELFSIEVVVPLYRRAQKTLRELNIHNVRFRRGDGWKGWPKYAPYDGIIVAAAPEVVPDVLLEQLAIGGRMIIPVGPSRAQQLLELRRTEDGIEKRNLGAVSFVPLVSETSS